MTPVKLKKIISGFLLILGIFFLYRNWLIHGNTSQHWQLYLNRVPNKEKLTNTSYEMTFDEKNLYFNSQNHLTYSINQETGKINWIYSGQDYSYFSPTIIGDLVITSNSDGYIYGLDKNTGQELWHYEVPNNTYSDTRVSFSDNNDILYIGTRKGQLIALEIKTGKQLWQKELLAIDNTVSYLYPPIHFGQIWTYKNQILIVHSPSNSLVSVDQKTGKELWISKKFSYTSSPPLFKGKYAIFKHNGSITSTDIETGKTYTQLLNNNKTDKILLKDLGPQSEAIAVVENQTTIFSPDLQSIYGQTDFGPFINSEKNSQPLLFSQNFTIQKNITTISKLNLADAQKTNYLSFSFSPFLLSNQDEKNLILANSSGYIVGINIDDWHELFKAKLDFEPLKIINTPDGYLVITQRPRFYLGFTLISKSGEILWNYNPSNPIENNSLFFHKDRIYFVTSDGRQLESFKISLKKPNNLNIKQINFSYELNEEDNPYLERRPNKTSYSKLDYFASKIVFFVKNFKEAYKFKFESSFENGIYNVKIHHLDTFYDRPQDQVKINVLAINKETKEKYRFNGYYSGRNLWEANFLPNLVGDYNIYILIITRHGINLHQENFNVESTSYNPLLIREKNFIDNNGEIFIPLGIEDTFIDYDYDSDYLNQIAKSSEIEPVTDWENYKYYSWEEHLQEFIKQSGVNFYRYGVGNFSPSLTYKAVDGQFIPSLNGSVFGDTLLKSLRKNNVRVMMTIFSFYPPYDTELEISQPKNQRIIKDYLDYVVARYSAYVDLWEIGNEANSDEAFYKFVVSYLRKIDPYQRPISTNWEEPSSKIFDYISIHHYEDPEIGFSQIKNTLKNINESNSQKPVIISEFGLKKNSWFEKSKLQLRITAWASFFQQIGLVIWNQGQNGIYENANNANIYLGPTERTVLKNLISFVPTFKYPMETNQFIIEETEIQAYTLKDEEHFAAYLINLGLNYDQGYFILPAPAHSKVTIIDPESLQTIESFETYEDNETILLPKIKEDLAIKVDFY